MTDTKMVTDRRELHFQSMRDILDDARSLGTDETQITATGNWSPAQIVEHVTFFIEGSLDGLAIKAPLFLRIAGPMMRKGVISKPMKPGFTLPVFMRTALPAQETTWSDAMERLETAIGRVEGGERMTKRSPVFGEMNHDQWTKLHCRHAEMHFSFMRNA